MYATAIFFTLLIIENPRLNLASPITTQAPPQSSDPSYATPPADDVTTESPAPLVQAEFAHDIPEAQVHKMRETFKVPEVAAHYVHLLPGQFRGHHSHGPAMAAITVPVVLPPAPPHYWGHFLPASWYYSQPNSNRYWMPRPKSRLFTIDPNASGFFGLPVMRKKIGNKGLSPSSPIGRTGGGQQTGYRGGDVAVGQPDSWSWPDDQQSGPLVMPNTK